MKLRHSLLALLCIVVVNSAMGARIYVTTETPGIGTGACSLQEAIYSSVLHDTLDGKYGIAIDATDQGNPPDHFITTMCVIGDGNDTIVLPTDGTMTMKSSLQPLGFVDGDAYNYLGPTATPLIFSTITIEGNGAELLWDPKDSASVRLFAIGGASIKTPNGTASGIGSLTLRNVYVKGFHVKGGDGRDGGGGGLGAGGAIYLDNGALTVEGTTFEGNAAFGGKGGFSGHGEGGGGGLSGSGGRFGGGGGGARGDGGDGVDGILSGQAGTGGGGGGGTVFSGGAAYVGGPGGYLNGGNGGGPGNDGARAKGAGGGGGGGGYCPGCGPVFTSKSGNGGDGDYGGGGGGGAGNGGQGGFGGGGGAGNSCVVAGCGGDGGFGGGGAGDGGAGGVYGGNGAGDRILGPSGGGGAALGGAIFSDSGTVVIRNSTFTGNKVVRGLATEDGGLGATNGADAGGAIFSHNADLTILNSTFSGNQSTGSGGGVAIHMGDSDGADIFIRLTLANSIFANNGANECLFTGNVHTQGAGNLIMSNGSGTQPFGACPRADVTSDPQLGPLQDNGGFTPTMAIPFGSVAMSAADPPTSLTTDQRGQARPQVGGYDIGAYEVCRRQLAGGLIEPMFCSETTFAGYPTSSLTIQSSTPSGGTVTPAPGTYSVPQNTVEVLSAAPAPGYYLKNWTGNVAQPNSPTTTIIIGSQAQTVTANFQLHDFTLAAAPASFTLPLGGTTATSNVTAAALGDFADPITLTATGHPAGVSASLSANRLTPVVGSPAGSTLTIAVGQSVTPLSFTETITGNSTGLSGALTHLAQVNVKFVITPEALVTIINQDLALGCIVGAGFAQSLIAKVNAYQTLASGGHLQGATNVLAAFQYEVQAQIGHQIVTSCNDPVGGNPFSPGQALIADAQALQATLGAQVKSSPIVGTVASSSLGGIPGTIVNLRSGKTVIATASTDTVGFYYFDPANLTPGAQYSVDVTIPHGYRSASPESQTFNWSANPVVLAQFVLN